MVVRGFFFGVGCCLLFFLLSLSNAKYNYRAVLPMEEIGIEDYFLPSSANVKRDDKFLIYNDRLYLAYQKVYPTPLLITYVSEIDWTLDELRDLRRKHPQYDSLWHDSQSGVDWIE